MAASEINDFINALTTTWQRDQCAEVLRITRSVSVPLRESIKWGNPFFEHKGAIVKWFVAKEWVHIYFYKGYRIADREGCFEPTDNIKMRTIKLFEDRPINAPAFATLLEVAIALNSG